MNEHDPIEEALSKLRDIRPPREVQAANRQRVRSELRSGGKTHWWQSSIRVPLPAAVAVAAMLGLSFSILVFNIMEPQAGPAPTPPSMDINTGTALVVASEHGSIYTETHGYISGIGVINQHVRYQIKE